MQHMSNIWSSIHEKAIHVKQLSFNCCLGVAQYIYKYQYYANWKKALFIKKNVYFVKAWLVWWLIPYIYHKCISGKWYLSENPELLMKLVHQSKFIWTFA